MVKASGVTRPDMAVDKKNIRGGSRTVTQVREG
jgi:hypothetical protein